jgi:transcriptional regulator with XRE-family HTH domain
MKLKENIRTLRKQRGWTQAELAKKLKIKQYNVSDYEIGRIEPNVNTLIKLANAFDVSLDYLVGRNEEDLEPGDINQFINPISDPQIIRFNEAIKQLRPEEKRKMLEMLSFMTDSIDKK